MAAALVAGALPVASAAVPGDGLLEHAAELRDPAGVEDELAGTAVAIDGDTIVVGAPGDEIQGRVLVFDRDPVTRMWSLTQTLEDPDGADYDDFGSAVAIGGETLVVGDPGAIGNRGKVHIFERASGSWHRISLKTGVTSGARLGTSVAVRSGTLAVAGAPGDNVTCTNCGAAYVFGKTGSDWSLYQDPLVMAGADSQEQFGSAVAIGVGYIVVGAPEETGGGAVVVFGDDSIDGKPTWVQSQKLTSAQVSSQARLGASVDIDGEVIVAGAPEDSVSGIRRGSVSVFTGGLASFSLAATLRAPDFASYDLFGWSVGVDAGVVVGGAPRAGGSIRGRAHIFTTAGAHLQQLVAPESDYGDDLGTGVAIDGGVVVAGTPQRERSGISPGVAHVFEDLPAELLCGGFGVTVRGTAGPETLTGTEFRDVIRGYGGNDTLKGQGGNDVICGDDGDDLLQGGPGDDVLYGGDGNDKLRAAAGDDVLDGGPGSDRLLPEAGKDLVNGGGGSDIVDYLAAEGPVSVNLAAGTATYTPAGESPWSQTLVGVEKVDGSSFADTLVGDGKRNLLRGKQGADMIRGGGDDDTLVGGTGADTIYGGDGKDLVKGQADDDRLFGEAGNDRVVGGHGDDELSGGPGNDVLRGGLRSHRGTFVNHLDGGTGIDDCLWPFDVLINCP